VRACMNEGCPAELMLATEVRVALKKSGSFSSENELLSPLSLRCLVPLQKFAAAPRRPAGLYFELLGITGAGG